MQAIGGRKILKDEVTFFGPFLNIILKYIEQFTRQAKIYLATLFMGTLNVIFEWKRKEIKMYYYIDYRELSMVFD